MWQRPLQRQQFSGHWGERAEAHRLAWPAEIREGFREEVACVSGLEG